MPNSNSIRLQLPEGFSETHFLQTFGDRLTRAETRHLTFWDTFEWGIWFGGCLLFSKGKHFWLCRRDAGWIGAEWAAEKINTEHPRFARDFKAIKGRLSGLLKLRGLAPVLEVTFRQRITELHNESEEIICQIELIEVAPGKHAEEGQLRYCRLLPAPGHEEEVSLVTESLTQLGAVLATEGPLDVLLRNAGRTPHKYTLRPHVPIDWLDPAREVVGRIVRTMLAIARSNEHGICNDIDTEFLHDYRICIRKIRATLGLIKGVYPSRETVKIREALAHLARETNRLRDLDVYFLARKKHLALLPPVFQPALESILHDFELERVDAFQKVTEHLQSHTQTMEDLDHFFKETTPHPLSQTSELPIGPLVFERIYKHYRKIRNLSNELDPDASDEAMHALRIECKKLRYLMEFFTELIPKEAAGAMEKPLKQLQNRLGEFNDASVQQKFLLDYWKQHPRGDEHFARALSIGGVVSVLNYRQSQQREKILEALTTFSNETTATLFKQTFTLPPA